MHRAETLSKVLSSRVHCGWVAQVLYNHVEHEKNGIFYGFSPTKTPHGSDTNENRGYDQSGMENNVTGNTGHIYRQKLYNQSYLTVDGEGILVQCSNGNNQYRNVWNKNDLSGGGSGYIAYYGVDVVDDCIITDNKVYMRSCRAWQCGCRWDCMGWDFGRCRRVFALSCGGCDVEAVCG